MKKLSRRLVTSIFAIIVGISGCGKDSDSSAYSISFREFPISEHSDTWSRFTEFDTNGILLVNYDILYGNGLGKQFNPLTTSQLALANYNEYIKNKQNKYLNYFLILSDNLHKKITSISDDNYGFFYAFAYPRYNLESPWQSGLANSTALSVLLRSYSITKSENTKKLIINLKNNLLSSTETIGVLANTPDGGVWIEEYPSTPSSYVLNGFLFSIISLREYLNIFPQDENVKSFYEKLLLSLKTDFHYYDTGNWLLYDRYERSPVNAHYMKFQAVLLNEIFILTKDNFSLEKSQLIEKYRKAGNPYNPNDKSDQ